MTKLKSSLPSFCGIFNHLKRLLHEEMSGVWKDMHNDTLNGTKAQRDKKQEEQNRGKLNWEHLNEDLHVLIITVEDAQNRAEIKLKRAFEEVKKLLVPAAEDSLKKMQLMELAILNGA
ncbi:Protein quaking [Fukomys damarensis]|uniref:Protein quaking n=1 Tax=Fukomys damarensis TaxID=885580 RepID=A0A091E3J2_FUKDA|nr:Protein quaking [Fukomys damarensis]